MEIEISVSGLAVLYRAFSSLFSSHNWPGFFCQKPLALHKRRKVTDLGCCIHAVTHVIKSLHPEGDDQLVK